MNLHIDSGNYISGTVQGAAESHTKRICSFLPVACANFFNVANDGPLWPEAKLPSIRVIAVALVPIRSATCAWVNPACLRAASISSSRANSSSMASYSALNAGSCIHFATISSCVIVGGLRLPAMLYLLHSGFSLLTFSDWCFLSFLDEAVQHDDALTCESAIKHTGNTIAAFDSKLKKSVTKRTCVRFTEITTVDFHSFNEMFVPNSHTQWKLVNLKLNLFAVVLNSIGHSAKYNKIVMLSQVLDSLSSGRYSAQAAAKSVAGLRIPEFSTAHNRASSGFFMRSALVHLSMVAQAGAPSGAPVSVEAGNANSVWATTNHGFASVGGSNNHSAEDAIMATIPTLAQPEINLTNGRIVTSSLAVAAYFSRRHDNIIQKIQSLECSPQFIALNFKANEYNDSTGRQLTCYEITRSGFMLLVMGFTDKKAAHLKENYINAFDAMETQLLEKPVVSLYRSEVLLTIENGVVIYSRPVRYDEITASLESIFEMAERQGYLVIHADDLKSLTFGNRKRGDS